jgi:hypothetical protein
MAEAIEQIRAARQPDGTRIQERRHPGRVWFEVDVDAGESSKWLTYYGTKVLEWWDASDPGRPSDSMQHGVDEPTTQVTAATSSSAGSRRH